MERQREDYMMAQLGDSEDGRKSRQPSRLPGAGNAWANRPRLMEVDPRPRAPATPTEAADDSFESADGGEAETSGGEKTRFDTATDDDIIDDDIEQLFDGVLELAR
jgi:hypothetical protein